MPESEANVSSPRSADKADPDDMDLPAPPGWKKKYIPKKKGTPRKQEVFFISPTGEEVKTRNQLDRYLRKNPGGPCISEFHWSLGDTPRRSSRLSEKEKAHAEDVQPESESKKKTPSKRSRKSEGDTESGKAKKKSKTSITSIEDKEDEEMKDADRDDSKDTDQVPVEEVKVEEKNEDLDKANNAGNKIEDTKPVVAYNDLAVKPEDDTAVFAENDAKDVEAKEVDASKDELVEDQGQQDATAESVATRVKDETKNGGSSNIAEDPMVEEEKAIDTTFDQPGNVALAEPAVEIKEDKVGEMKESATEGIVVPPAEDQPTDNITVDHAVDVHKDSVPPVDKIDISEEPTTGEGKEDASQHQPSEEGKSFTKINNKQKESAYENGTILESLGLVPTQWVSFGNINVDSENSLQNKAFAVANDTSLQHAFQDLPEVQHVQSSHNGESKQPSALSGESELQVPMQWASVGNVNVNTENSLQNKPSGVADNASGQHAFHDLSKVQHIQSSHNGEPKQPSALSGESEELVPIQSVSFGVNTESFPQNKPSTVADDASGQNALQDLPKVQQHIQSSHNEESKQPSAPSGAQ